MQFAHPLLNPPPPQQHNNSLFTGNAMDAFGSNTSQSNISSSQMSDMYSSQICGATTQDMSIDNNNPSENNLT